MYPYIYNNNFFKIKHKTFVTAKVIRLYPLYIIIYSIKHFIEFESKTNKMFAL